MSNLMCILPKEWEFCPPLLMKHVLHTDLEDYFSKHHTLEGAVITIGDTTVVSKMYETFLWFRKIEDWNDAPVPNDYILLCINRIQ